MEREREREIGGEQRKTDRWRKRRNLNASIIMSMMEAHNKSHLFALSRNEQNRKDVSMIAMSTY
jgi:hypothetical protein